MGCSPIRRESSSPRVFLSFAALGTVLVLAGFAAKFFLKSPSFGQRIPVISWSTGGGMIASGGLLGMLRGNASVENAGSALNKRRETKKESGSLIEKKSVNLSSATAEGVSLELLGELEGLCEAASQVSSTGENLDAFLLEGKKLLDSLESKKNLLDLGTGIESVDLKGVRDTFVLLSEVFSIPSTEENWKAFLAILLKEDSGKKSFTPSEIKDAYSQFMGEEGRGDTFFASLSSQ